MGRLVVDASAESHMNRRGMMRGAGIALALMGLMLLFLFQQASLVPLSGVSGTTWEFIINRTLRFLINDLLVVLLIHSLFQKRSYTQFALVVQVVGFALILLPYFVIKFQYPGYNGPLISFLHRLVVNPLLMLLLIPAFYFLQLKR